VDGESRQLQRFVRGVRLVERASFQRLLKSIDEGVLPVKRGPDSAAFSASLRTCHRKRRRKSETSIRRAGESAKWSEKNKRLKGASAAPQIDQMAVDHAAKRRLR
jgi:hypothetical protein